MFQRAIEEKYAVGYFESWNLESLQGVLDAAEQTRSPIVIGFSGEFLSRVGRISEERLALYGALGKAAAESSSVPCCFIFNECTEDDSTRQAIQEGFNLVMPIDGENNYEEYVRRTAEIVALGHTTDVGVEGELGELPGGVGIDHEGHSTDPDQAEDFVTRTQVDLLAVSVGNIHCHTGKAEGLNLDLIEKIYNRVKTPLVLHGGTGIDAASLQESVKLGAAKVNYGTYVKLAYLDAIRKALGGDCSDPHFLYGYGGEEDVMVTGRYAVRDAVLERIQLLGCCGKA
jgi:ketose-bisphosphate aldolase